MSNDIFADLLKGTAAGAASSQNNANSNLSLNQKMNSSMNSSMSNGKSSNAALDLDFLDNYVSNSKQNDNSAFQVNTKQPSATSDLDDFLLFSGSNSAASSNNARSTEYTTTNGYNKTQNLPPSTDTNLLDDFFGHPITVTSNDATPKSISTSSNTPSKDPSPKSEQKQQKNGTNKERKVQELKDAALAELLEMGFSVEKANTALESTKTGYDLNGAISFLMEQAHSSTRQTRKISSTLRSDRREEYEPTEKNGDDFGKIVNDLSSAASFLFNSGKKKIQEGVDLYRQQKFENNDGQPLWMKNQLKYKANSMKLPNQDEEDNEEMDRETMKILTQKQRLREQRLKQERERNYDLLGSDTTQPSSQVLNKERKTPQRRPHTPDHSSQMSSSTRNTSDSSQEIYKSASRHRSSNRITKTYNPQTEVPSLIETSSIPVSQSSKPAIPSFSVPPLDSAQTMAFKSSREIAQEKFKSGDYTSALENYLSATNVIPSDHPLQIIINSNLALVYSKLGNPKEQLVVSTKGLDLISNSTSNCHIGALSDITIEDNKNLKNFWVKLMTKKAESLEFMEKWKDAKEAYEKLIGEGESSKVVMDGKNRCLKMLNPRPTETAKPKPKPQSKSKSKTQTMNPPRRTPSPQNSEALKNVQQSNLKKDKEDEEKFNLHDTVEVKLDNWRMGNKDNIRALLCSLDKILWPGLNWKPVQLTDLVLDKKVKIYYMKAVAKTHPDKINNNESVENKMIANGVFITLNEAWETFKQSKGM